ncbi:MAG: hypothetical protein H0U70_07930 [Tatlockia sp.]|nr:hypothetical protein [Tatlockia sp.]
MSEENEPNELSAWMSTYGLITAERILERYQIRLQHEELFTAMKNPSSFYHKLLIVPLKNVFNGIILQQAYDYQVYAQKLFIDYLVSGESSKPDEAAGGFTREDLEKERKNLVALTEDFRKFEIDHYKLIAQSQKILIEQAQIWQNALSSSAATLTLHLNKEEAAIKQMINVLLVHPDFTNKTATFLKADFWQAIEKVHGESLTKDLKQIFINEVQKLEEFNLKLEDSLAGYAELVREMGLSLRNWRSEFYNFILRSNNLFNLLPEYQSNESQDKKNKETLDFDSEIG